MKKSIFSLIEYFTLLFAVFLLNSCTTALIELDAGYQTRLHYPAGSEVVIGKATVESDVVVEDTLKTPNERPMGKSYRVRDSQKSQKHTHESILDELLDAAQRSFPNEMVDIRNATIGYKYIGVGKPLQLTRWDTVARTRLEAGKKITEWRQESRVVTMPTYKFQIIYYADIVKITPLIR